MPGTKNEWVEVGDCVAVFLQNVCNADSTPRCSSRVTSATHIDVWNKVAPASGVDAEGGSHVEKD